MEHTSIKKKMVKKVIVIMSLIILLCMIGNTKVLAKKDKEDLGLGSLEEYKYESTAEEKVDKALTSITINIISVIRSIGMVVSVIVLMVLGIKYMAGSIEERANYKETMPPYLVGAFLVFAITTVPSFIYNIVTKF